PIFLFASGYLTALSRSVPLGKRVRSAIIPYAIAFVAAYAYMALHNPSMDHRIATTIARFTFAYVFVYYYVFVYIGCTLVLWSVLAWTHAQRSRSILLLLAIALGLLSGSYLDPLLSRFGASEALIEEARMRDIPFWFSFAALGAWIGGTAALTNIRKVKG